MNDLFLWSLHLQFSYWFLQIKRRIIGYVKWHKQKFVWLSVFFYMKIGNCRLDSFLYKESVTNNLKIFKNQLNKTIENSYFALNKKNPFTIFVRSFMLNLTNLFSIWDMHWTLPNSWRFFTIYFTHKQFESNTTL